MLCVSGGEGINVVDDVINEVGKCGARGRERALAREREKERERERERIYIYIILYLVIFP